MNVEKITLDAVNAQIKINLSKSDYQENVEKTLRSYRQKANVPGFRPGMVPMAMIKRLYGKGVTAEEVNKVLSDALFNYIRDNQIDILGEPLPSTEQQPQDLDTQDELEFLFDIALVPELNYTLNKKDTLPYYRIRVSDEMVDSQIKSYAARGGRYEKVDTCEGNDTVKGLLCEISDSEDAVRIEDALVLPAYMKGEEEKAKFLGAKTGDVITYNPYKAAEGNESELASLLRLPKEKAKEVTGDFTFEVKEINRFVESDVNEELFEQVYGKDAVKTEEEFRARVREDLSAQFTPQSDYRFMVDAEKKLTGKLKDVVLPEAFLKRWLLASDENRKAEDLEKDMPKLLEELKWHLLKEDIAKKNNLSVAEEDIKNMAKSVTRQQFAQYGMANVPDELLEQYAAEMTKKPEQVRNLQDQAMSLKISDFLKTAVKINESEISTEEFTKLFDKE